MFSQPLINHRIEGPWDRFHLANNAATVDEAISHRHYRRFYPPGVFYISTLARNHNERFEWIEFPDASSANRIVTNDYIPPSWRKGQLRTTLYLGGALSGKDLFRWNIIVNAHPPGADIFTPTELNASQDFPGPLLTTYYTTATFTSYLQVTGDEQLLGLRVLREGAHANDVYAATAYFYGALIEFQPTIRNT